MTCDKWPRFKEIGTKKIKLEKVVAKEKKNPGANPVIYQLKEENAG